MRHKTNQGGPGILLPSGGEAPTSKAGPSKDQRLSQQIQTPQGYAAMHGPRTPLTSRGQVTIGGDVSNKNDCRTRYLRELRLLQPPAVPILSFCHGLSELVDFS